MLQSNYGYFQDRPLVNDEYKKRLTYLEGQIKALQEYHQRAKGRKKITIMRLIIVYEDLSQSLYARLEKAHAI